MSCNLLSLKGKHLLITGASSGIGKRCAITCSEYGAVITLVGRNVQNLEETKLLLKGSGHVSIVQDISQIDAIVDIVKVAVEKNGGISGFLHSAGIEKTLPLKMHKRNVFEEIYTINTIAAFEFARIISQKKYINPLSASFVFVASIMGSVSNAGLTGYSSSKGALIAGAKSMAIELCKKGIRVNTISPGHILETRMSQHIEEMLSDTALEKLKESYPLGLGTTEDVANAAIFLLSDASKWITGTDLTVDGGYCAQ